MKRNRSSSSSEDMETYMPAPRLRPRVINNAGPVTGPHVHSHEAVVVPEKADEMSKKHFFEKLKDTRADHDTSDFTIVCSGKDIKVHRLVLSLHSGYFARLFKSDFKENVESKITLVKEPFAAVVAMIQFFYELTYDGISSIQEHATVWILGDKFEIPGLMEYAQKRFDNACKASVESYEMDLTIATPLIEVVPLIYENTPPNTVGLRATVAKWWNELMCWNRYIISKDEWREMITKHPEFGVDVITRLGMD